MKQNYCFRQNLGSTEHSVSGWGEISHTVGLEPSNVSSKPHMAANQMTSQINKPAVCTSNQDGGDHEAFHIKLEARQDVVIGGNEPPKI